MSTPTPTILTLVRTSSGQYTYEIPGSVPVQFGTYNARSTVEQARSRFSFDQVRSSFITGREYRSDGTPQEIVCTYVPHMDQWSDDACDRVLVDMVDNARGMHEMVIVLRGQCDPDCIHSAVLASYDSNSYVHTYGHHVGDIAPSK